MKQQKWEATLHSLSLALNMAASQGEFETLKPKLEFFEFFDLVEAHVEILTKVEILR